MLVRIPVLLVFSEFNLFTNKTVAARSVLVHTSPVMLIAKRRAALPVEILAGTHTITLLASALLLQKKMSSCRVLWKQLALSFTNILSALPLTLLLELFHQDCAELVLSDYLNFVVAGFLER